MSDRPAALLSEVIARYPDSYQDIKKLESMLNDMFKGEYKGERFVLVTAVRERIPDDLLANRDNIELVYPRLVKRLTEIKITRQDAEWAVSAWAAALKVKQPENQVRDGKPVDNIDNGRQSQPERAGYQQPTETGEVKRVQNGNTRVNKDESASQVPPTAEKQPDHAIVSIISRSWIRALIAGLLWGLSLYYLFSNIAIIVTVPFLIIGLLILVKPVKLAGFKEMIVISIIHGLFSSLTIVALVMIEVELSYGYNGTLSSFIKGILLIWLICSVLSIICVLVVKIFLKIISGNKENTAIGEQKGPGAGNDR